MVRCNLSVVWDESSRMRIFGIWINGLRGEIVGELKKGEVNEVYFVMNKLVDKIVEGGLSEVEIVDWNFGIKSQRSLRSKMSAHQYGEIMAKLRGVDVKFGHSSRIA